MSARVTAGTTIRADADVVWQLTQTPEAHVRWDARFTDIDYLPRNAAPEAPQRFLYATRLGLGVRIDGWGETFGRADRRASALRFGSDDPKSLIRAGAGSWVYDPVPGGVRFHTVYDYDVRWGLAGRVLDRALFRPLIQWATRWSFDRLRIWIERGVSPERSRLAWAAQMTLVAAGITAAILARMTARAPLAMALALVCILGALALRPIAPSGLRGAERGRA